MILRAAEPDDYMPQKHSASHGFQTLGISYIKGGGRSGIIWTGSSADPGNRERERIFTGNVFKPE